MLDKQGKLFGLISLLDMAVLLFLIFVIGASIYSATETSADQKLSVTVSAPHLKEDVAVSLAAYRGEFTDADGNRYRVEKTGDALQDTQSVLPDETAPTASPSEEPTPSPTEAPIPDSFHLTLYLSTVGEEGEEYYKKADGKPISPGDTLILEGADTRIRMTVSAIDKK